MGWTKEFGLAWPRDHRSALATLGEALEVLWRGPRIVEERGLWRRFVDGWREVVVGY